MRSTHIEGYTTSPFQSLIKSVLPRIPERCGKPAGVNAMGHTVTYRVRLWTLDQFLFHAEIVSSTYHPPNTKSFYIGNKGLTNNPGMENIYSGYPASAYPPSTYLKFLQK